MQSWRNHQQRAWCPNVRVAFQETAQLSRKLLWPSLQYQPRSQPHPLFKVIWALISFKWELWFMSRAVRWVCSSVPTAGTAPHLTHHIPACSCEETRNWGCFTFAGQTIKCSCSTWAFSHNWGAAGVGMRLIRVGAGEGTVPGLERQHPQEQMCNVERLWFYFYGSDAQCWCFRLFARVYSLQCCTWSAQRLVLI